MVKNGGVCRIDIKFNMLNSKIPQFKILPVLTISGRFVDLWHKFRVINFCASLKVLKLNLPELRIELYTIIYRLLSRFEKPLFSHFLQTFDPFDPLAVKFQITNLLENLTG